MDQKGVDNKEADVVEGKVQVVLEGGKTLEVKKILS